MGPAQAKAGGKWDSVFQRYNRLIWHWPDKGVWESLFKALVDDPYTQYAMIDATIVRANQYSAGVLKGGLDQAIGRSRGGVTSKTNAIVDALGKPLVLKACRWPSPRHQAS
jgi:transposase